MITEYRKVFEANEAELVERYTANAPSSYNEIVKDVIQLLHNNIKEYGTVPKPDPNRIILIDHGDYQGTLLFVIGQTGYQPSTYLSVYIGYGSCSGCDAFQDIEYGRSYDSETDRAKGFVSLANDVVNGLKIIGEVS
jgi:hypothetical protein